MRLLGLPTNYVGALIGGGIIAAVLLYLRQWGRRCVVVSFSPLSKRVLSEADVGTSRRRVLEIFSLLLQAAVIVLLALALGRPLVGRAPATQAIVLDTSASMLAQRRPRGDRLAAAKQRALELLDRFSDEDRVALVTTGGDARLVFAPTRDHYALRERIASTEPCACEGRLREAVELARGVMPDGGAIYVLTDGNESLEGDAHSDLHVELFGAPAANVGITLFGVRAAPAQPGRYEAALELSNFSPVNARAQLRVSIDGQLVDLRDVRLGPNEHQRAPLPSLFAGHGESLLKAELFNIEFLDTASGVADALSEDNVGYALLVPEAERPIRLLAPPGSARFVREALRANPRYRLIEADAQLDDAVRGRHHRRRWRGHPAGTGPLPRARATTRRTDHQARRRAHHRLAHRPPALAPRLASKASTSAPAKPRRRPRARRSSRASATCRSSTYAKPPSASRSARPSTPKTRTCPCGSRSPSLSTARSTGWPASMKATPIRRSAVVGVWSISAPQRRSTSRSTGRADMPKSRCAAMR